MFKIIFTFCGDEVWYKCMKLQNGRCATAYTFSRIHVCSTRCGPGRSLGLDLAVAVETWLKLGLIVTTTYSQPYIASLIWPVCRCSCAGIQ